MESRQVDLYPRHAGIDEGRESSLANSANSPQGVVTNLQGTGKFSNARIATPTFTFQSVNITPTGASYITGAVEGELTVNTSGVADADGLCNVSYVYQRVAWPSAVWRRTSGAQADDVDTEFRVWVSSTDGKGKAETLTSNATAAAILALGGRSGSAQPSLARQGARLGHG